MSYRREPDVGFAISVMLTLLYILVGVVTFGYNAAKVECKESWSSSCTEQKVVPSMGAALFWPFYWSWEAFE